jgi:DNA-binding CsgD family transcriptional regulator
MSVDKVYEAIVKELVEFTNEVNAEKTSQYAQLPSLIHGFSSNEYSLKAIVDLTKLRLLAISSNLETLTGYTKEDYNKHNILLFLRAIELENTLIPVTFVRWAIDAFKEMPSNTKFEAMQLNIGGVNFKTKHGQDQRALIRLMPLELGSNGFPNISIVTVDFITHLLKPSSTWWGRIAYNDTHSDKFHLILSDKKYQYQDLLSNREKDVLNLVAEGLDAKEIAKKLFISISTVDNHRQNAALRIGAKDTTALIQICKMCGVL